MLKREESGTGTPVIAADALISGGMSAQVSNHSQPP
jgi:hypothetical protein